MDDKVLGLIITAVQTYQVTPMTENIRKIGQMDVLIIIDLILTEIGYSLNNLSRKLDLTGFTN